ncbi:hypothetical protein K458DRAFT_27915 [Lentithecium fluviatile CBS 122367]|uniref:Uncharacterized protein n=1 Tax=Lentithecium fluviatile CBS 122367 TaxID=1168545 RepID=A0A6G1J3T6_9PLEO|nr:hypothetical protein K458DRAFT_27915 [Lentithecium fluviatile CBS 122367]
MIDLMSWNVRTRSFEPLLGPDGSMSRALHSLGTEIASGRSRSRSRAGLQSPAQWCDDHQYSDRGSLPYTRSTPSDLVLYPHCLSFGAEDLSTVAVVSAWTLSTPTKCVANDRWKIVRVESMPTFVSQVTYGATSVNLLTGGSRDESRPS